MENTLFENCRENFYRDGFVMMRNVISSKELNQLRQELDLWTEESKSFTDSFGRTIDGRARFDVEPATHSKINPALRRVSSPIEISERYLSFTRDNIALDLTAYIFGPNIKLVNTKINLKLPGSGTDVKYHQDFPFEPHSNDDLMTTLYFLDDVTLENGPLEVVPGSHTREIFSLWHGGEFTGSVSQAVEKKAKSLGVEEIFIENLQEEFVKDYVFPMFRANALYEGTYLLGTAIARPLIAKRQIEIAKIVGADAVAHGATGKGNDQVRFELGYYANNPKIEVIAPWRDWEFESRNDLLDYAEKNQITVPKDKMGEPPFSTDANLLHTSSEGKLLEDPWLEPPEHIFSRTKSIEDTPNKAEVIIIGFENGDPVSINEEKLKPHEILTKLNTIAGNHGVGRIDIVENRFVGMKSRGVYETPGGTILLDARRAIESITLDKGEAHLKDELMPKYAELIYNGFWFSPEREMLQSLIDCSQKNVNGVVKLKLYKGNTIVVGRKSKSTIYSPKMATFEEEDIYDQKDAEGFIKLNALRLKLLKKRI